MTDPSVAIADQVCGLAELGGPRPQIRLWYRGSWDGPLVITVSFDAEGGEVSVIDPGADFRARVMAGLSGQPVVVAATRTEKRAIVWPERLGELVGVWALIGSTGDGQLRGNDGHWIELRAHDPVRGAHVGRDWCPTPDSPVGRVAAAVLRVAILAEPQLAQRPPFARLIALRPR